MSADPTAGSQGKQSRRAVIDVGTNSVKLLVADVSADGITPIEEKSEQTRLGRGFYDTHRLQPDAILQTGDAVAQFAAIAREWNPESIRIIATSAARDALNQRELIDTIESASGLRVEVISGEQEADWVFRGVTSDPVFASRPLLIIDVGGGSTELVLGAGEHQIFCASYPLGSVRLLENYPPHDPPTCDDWERCSEALRGFISQHVAPVVQPALDGVRGNGVQLVGTGGTTTILARIQLGLEKFDRDAIEGSTISFNDLRQERVRLWGLPLHERRKIVGLPSKRADVILMGAAIFEVVMEEFDFASVRVSTRGLRFAAVMTP